MDLYQRLTQASESLHKVSGATCLILPLIILVVVGIRAISPRGIPIFSIDICELLMWFLTYLSLGFVWRMGRHVTVEVMINHLPPSWRRWNDTAVLAILLIIALVMMTGGFQVAWDSWMVQKKTTNEFPEFYFSPAIPMGLFFLVFELCRSMRKRLFPQKAPGTER